MKEDASKARRLDGRGIGRMVALLQKAQRQHGYLDRKELERIAEATGRSPAQVYGVATFYNQFRFNPPGRHPIRVCLGTACHLKGGNILLDEWRRRLEIDTGQTTDDGEFSLERVACVGCCSLAPVILDGEKLYPEAQVSTVGGIVLRSEMERDGRLSEEEALKALAALREPQARPGVGTKCVDGQVARMDFDELLKLAEQEHCGLWDSNAPVVLVGGATCGRAAGSEEVIEGFRSAARETGLEVNVTEVGCMGHCYAEPMAIVKRPGEVPLVFANLRRRTAELLVKGYLSGEEPLWDIMLGALEPNDLYPSMEDLPRYGLENRRLLRRCGRIAPLNVCHYLALGGYRGLHRALSMKPEDVINELKRSGLRGLGGAGFPTWKKWQSCREAEGPLRYVICNADEGDPGAFMDRTVLESDPFAVLEGMAIAGYALGSAEGVVYVRAEYPLAVERIAEAARRAEQAGLLGRDILGSGFDFHITVTEGAGAFVCGESTALMASLEGRRGYPRVRPPHSVRSGLYGHPTLLNNVKTLANVSYILEKGADAFNDVGTDSSKGTAVFALAGKVVNAGLVEVPMGMTLRQVVFDIGGGVPNGRKIKAVQIGGPSGGCLPESVLDVPVDFDSLKEAGGMMGSGGLVVLDSDDCVVDTARYFMEFLAQESCGQCSYCREGTIQMLEILDRITGGSAGMEDLERLEDLAGTVQAGSLCNLGKTAAAPILTTLKYFRDEYEAHVRERVCPARACRELITYYIDPKKCARGCDACVGSCPTEAIFTDQRLRVKQIDLAKCVKCRSCVAACPAEYDAVVLHSPAGAPAPWEDDEEQVP
jgi:NADH-quinone oxidoreductase subunit F